MSWEYSSDFDNGNVKAVIVFLSARLSELSSPERLAEVHTIPKSIKNFAYGTHIVYGNNNIVPVDTHLTNKPFYGFMVKRSVELSLDPEEDKGQKDHCFNGKGEC
jgi:hypothetical protein